MSINSWPNKWYDEDIRVHTYLGWNESGGIVLVRVQYDVVAINVIRYQLRNLSSFQLEAHMPRFSSLLSSVRTFRR